MENPPGPRSSSRFLESLNRVLASGNADDALPAACDLLAGIDGVRAVAVVLGRAERVRASVFRGDPPLHDALLALARDSLRTGPPAARDAHIRLLPVGASAAPLGWLAAALDPASAEPAERALAAALHALGTQWALAAELADVKAAGAQQRRWFSVMDAQLRVLDRERQKFVAVVNQSDTFVFVVDERRAVPWMNQPLAKELESLAEGGGAVRFEDVCRVIGMLPPEPERCPVARVFRDGDVVHEEPRAVAGQLRHLIARYIPIRGADGRPAEVLVVVQDLGDLAVLRRSEARYRQLFDASPDALIMVDPGTGRPVLSNRVATELTGWTAEELLHLDLEALHDASEWPDVAATYALVPEARDVIVRERTIVGKDGRRVPAEVSASRFDLDGRAVTLLEIRDVTRTKRLETELRHAQKMEAVGRLAGGVAHDFNNLLSVILGKTELLAARAEGDERMDAALHAVRRAALRGSLLTRKLLAFSRKEVVKVEVLDLGEIIRDVHDLLGGVLGEQVVLCTERGQDCLIRGDRGQIEQVLMNLVVNARDAVPDGGHIAVRCRAGSGAQVTLEVEDDGIGMDEATQSRLFEPFFTTKPRGEGTGLGLSTVYGIVTEGGGTIRVHSAPGRGTRFEIRLPRVASSLAAAPDTAAPVQSRKCTEGGRILLVEDEEEVREMAAEALEIEGYAVTRAANAEEALSIWETEGDSFQLLVTDVIMPGLSGGELAQRVRRIRPATKVLYMSGYNDDAIVRYGVSVSEADFLQKPFTLESLARKVRFALEAVAAGDGTGPS